MASKEERREWNREHNGKSPVRRGLNRVDKDKNRVLGEVKVLGRGWEKKGQGYRGNHRQVIKRGWKVICRLISSES